MMNAKELPTVEFVDYTFVISSAIEAWPTPRWIAQRELNQRNLALPIVFLTGHGDIPMAVRATKAGAIEFLTKPFRGQDLLDAVQIALDRDLDPGR
jgi:CheY-like chemotaxis protein